MSELVTIDPPLMPGSTQDLGRVLDASPRLDEIDVDIIRRAKSAADCDVELLPFLAWERGVNLWFDDWPEWKKRRITAQIYEMLALVGTVPGWD
ncbi:MAG: phage tail protein I, partial [Pseudomonadota bacterium]